MNLFEPWVDPRMVCLERVTQAEDGEALLYTALAVGDDGTLYAASPLQGTLYAFDDRDGDGLPDARRVYASGLERPNALTWSDGALYVAGGSKVYRIVDGNVETLVSDVPDIGGFWPAGIVVEGGALYVTTGASCDGCISADAMRGAVLRYADEGVTVEARGLRSPGDLVWYQGALWTNDSLSLYPATGRQPVSGWNQGDEINRVEVGADFGFPGCPGRPDDIDRGFPCDGTVTGPRYTLPSYSQPAGMAAYRGDAFPELRDSLLVALRGSLPSGGLVGYQVLALRFRDAVFEREVVLVPNGDTNAVRFENDELNFRGSGFYPRQPLDVAVSPEGWIYISVTHGLIMALRQR